MEVMANIQQADVVCQGLGETSNMRSHSLLKIATSGRCLILHRSKPRRREVALDHTVSATPDTGTQAIHSKICLAIATWVCSITVEVLLKVFLSRQSRGIPSYDTQHYILKIPYSHLSPSFRISLQLLISLSLSLSPSPQKFC